MSLKSSTTSTHRHCVYYVTRFASGSQIPQLNCVHLDLRDQFTVTRSLNRWICQLQHTIQGNIFDITFRTFQISSRYTITIRMTRHLRQTILHFDLNRTILMSDTSGSRSIEDTVNYLLSECIWGYVDPTSTTPRWVCTSTTPSVVPPSPNSMTYKQFVASQLPYQTSIQEEQSKDLLRMTSTYDFNMYRICTAVRLHLKRYVGTSRNNELFWNLHSPIRLVQETFFATCSMI